MPNLITWISKNPHEPGDHFPKVDYKKTFIWSKPPKAIKGAMTLNTDGSYDYFGEFSTADAPNGKPADKLTDEDKKLLRKRFDEEKKRVDEFAKKLEAEEAKNKPLKNEIGRRCFDGTMLPLHLVLSGPASARVGVRIPLTAFASTAIVRNDPLEFFRWDLGNGRKSRSRAVTAIYDRPGSYTVRLIAVDRYGAIGTLKQRINITARAVARPSAQLSAVQPAAGEGSGVDSGVYAPPIASDPQEAIKVTVEGDQPGPTEFLVSTVDDQGKKRFLRGVTDQFGHALLTLGAGVAVAMIFKHFDKHGQPDQGSTCRFARQPSVLGETQELANVPKSGPAILRANSSIELGGRGRGIATWQVRGASAQTSMQVDGSTGGINTLAASDTSLVGKLNDNTILGQHVFIFTNAGVASNPFHANAVTLTFGALPRLRPGEVANVSVAIGGIRPQDNAVVVFSVGGAATVAGGGSTATSVVRDGTASVKIQATRPGELLITVRLEVSSPDFKPSP